MHDAQSSAPIAGVDVSVLGTAYAAMTDPEGRFTLSDVPAGAYTLLLVAEGYQPARQRADVPESGTVTVRIMLDPAGGSDDVLLFADRMPEPVGGLATIAGTVQYPEEAIRAGVEGRVIVQFVVDTTGTVRDAAVLRGIGFGCDEEALRAVSEARFYPALHQGRRVTVRMSLPVAFTLPPLAVTREAVIEVTSRGLLLLDGSPRGVDAILHRSGIDWATTKVTLRVSSLAPSDDVMQLRRAFEDVGLAELVEEVIQEPAKDDPDEIFVVVDGMPELIGGLDRLQRELRYPASAQRDGIEGRVIMQFVVETDGSVSEMVVVQGLSYDINAEAIRVVRSARFRPGKLDGKPVRVKMSLPITFRLR